MLTKERFKSFLFISILLHIALISLAALIYKSNNKVIGIEIFEISAIKIDSDKKSSRVSNKSDVIKTKPSKESFTKKSIKHKNSHSIEPKKDISDSKKKKHIEQNSQTYDLNIASVLSINTKDNNRFLDSKSIKVVAYPNYKLNPKPVYPIIARKRGFEGTVLLKVQVLKDGNVGKVNLEKSSNYEILDRSAIEAINKWIFIPGKKNGLPVASWVTVPVKFQLTST